MHGLGGVCGEVTLNESDYVFNVFAEMASWQNDPASWRGFLSAGLKQAPISEQQGIL